MFRQCYHSGAGLGERPVKKHGRGILVLAVGLVVVFGTAWMVYRYRAGPTQIVWARTLSEATAKARAGDRLIITDVYTDWCGWCKEMDVRTWNHPAVIERSENYVFLKLNAETEPDGVALQKRFGVVSYPTVLLLDSRGEEFERLEGYLPAEKFLANLRATLEDPDSLGNLKKQESREPENFDLRFKTGKKLLSRNAFSDARMRFEQILQKDPENRSQLADDSLFYLALCQAGLTETEKSLATLDRLFATYPQSNVVPAGFFMSAQILLDAGQTEAARMRLQKLLRDYPNDPLTKRAKRLLSEI
jgi:tetratricopeptide (TPR) repeat protein